MNADSIPTIYARALLELANNHNEAEELRAETPVLLSLLETERDFRTLIESPRIDRAAKGEVLEKVFRGRISGHLLDFLQVVTRKGREVFIVPTLQAFQDLYDHEIGLVRASVTTATSLAEEDVATFRDRLASKLGKKVELERRVDESILGGFVLRYDGKVADGSIRTSLDTIGARMLSAN